MKKIKLLPILVAIVTTSSGGKLLLEKNNQSIVRKKITYSYSNDNIIENTTFATTSTTTTNNTTIPTTTTITTTESKYKELAFLYGMSDDYSLEQLHDIIIKYSSYSHIDYDEAIKIIKENSNYIENDCVNTEAGIVKTLFDNCELGDYCDQSIIETRTMNRDEKEKNMIEICNSLGINDTDKIIILSIFRWETGHGESDLCVYCNNYGGITVNNGFGRFQTPEYGMYRAIKCMYNHIQNSKNNLGTDDMYSIIDNMASIYCPPTASEWARQIKSMTYSVDEYYNSFEEYKKYEK